MYGNTTLKRSPRTTHRYKPRPRLDTTTVYVERALVEWSKHQPEGFSGLVRLLLKAEHARREGLTAVAHVPDAPPPAAGEHAGPLPPPTPDA